MSITERKRDSHICKVKCSCDVFTLCSQNGTKICKKYDIYSTYVTTIYTVSSLIWLNKNKTSYQNEKKVIGNVPRTSKLF